MSGNKNASPNPPKQRAANAQAPAPGRDEGPARSDAGPLDLTVAKVSDVGRVRSHNEDFVDCFVPTDPEQLERKGALYLVADGMGGHQAGEVASQGAVEIVIRLYYGDTNQDVGASLVRAVRKANQQIYEQAQADPSKAGMGTTLVAAVILGRKVYVANVGDSRAYLISKTGIAQITEDHSWVEEQLKAGLLTQEQARRHPQRNLVTRVLGPRSSVEVDLFEGQMGDGDQLLLCTDGLTNHVEDLEIETVVREHPAQEAARLLVARANERGGTDNISLLIVGGRQAMAAAAAEKSSLRFPIMLVLAGAAVVLALLVAGLLFVPRLLESAPTPTGSPALTPATLPAEQVLPGPADGTTSAPEFVSPIQPAPEGTTAPIGATITPIGGAMPTAEAGTPAPTETLAPTPTQTPTATTVVAPPSVAPSATSPSPGPAQPTLVPAPILAKPDASAELRNKPRFTWQWTHAPLTGDRFFDLRIWSQQEQDAGMEPRGAVTPTKDKEAEIDLELVPAIQQYGTGTYYWTVVVVENRQNPKIVGQWGEKRRFRYAGPEAPEPKPKPPWPPPIPTLRP